MFLMLGLLVNPHEMLDVAGMALLIGLFMIFISRPLSVFLCLSPYRLIPFRAKLFTSWVGLRGAVPILFATYPVVAGLEHHSTLFNIVFFITILSLLLQGTTITALADRLKLSEPLGHDVEDFGIQLHDDSDYSLSEIDLTASMLASGNTLRDLHLPKGHLVVMIKRGEENIVPNGTVELHPGDRLLVMK